jgi:integrase
MKRTNASETIQGVYFRWKLRRRNGIYFADGRSSKIKVGRHSLETRNYDDALEALRKLDIVKAVEHGLAPHSILTTGSAALLDLEAGRDLYMKHVQRADVVGGARKNTVKRYRPVFAKFIDEFAASEVIGSWNIVNLRILENYGAWLDERDYAYRTEHLELTTLKQAINYFVAEGLLPSSCDFVLKMRNPSGSTTYCYRQEEVDAMLEVCKGRPDLRWLHDVILVLSYTGMRISEAAQLRASNIDEDVKFLILRDETRAGSREERRRGQSVKTGKDRTLPIHERIRPVLRFRSGLKQSRIFYGPKGGQLKPDVVRRALIREVIQPLVPRFPTPPGEAVGFKDGRLHSFRHYFCSVCAHDGVPEQVVMRWLGHASSAMVQRYFHLHSAESREQMNKVRPPGDAAPERPDAGTDVAGNVSQQESSRPDPDEDGVRRTG